MNISTSHIAKLLTASFLASILMTSTIALADDFSAVKTKVDAAIAADSRPAKDVLRDGNRKPIETLEFFGLRDDMKVIELVPGGGWYTRLLAPTLADKGKLYVAYGTAWMGDLLEQPGFEKVELLAPNHKLYRQDGKHLFSLEKADLGVKKVDMVLTFRNYHNLDTAARKTVNDAVFKSLKSGGVYGVVDHTRRHMEGDSGENGRRFDPVLAIKEIQAAGFVLQDYSNLHYRADDELRYEVGRKSVTGNTDRWTLKFVKP